MLLKNCPNHCLFSINFTTPQSTKEPDYVDEFKTLMVEKFQII